MLVLSRLLSKDDLESVCGQLAGSNTPASSSYFANCMNNLSTNGTDNGKNWFIFENSRFESMYKSYPTNQDIYNYYTYESYVPSQGEMTDDELLTAFRNAMIVKNT